MTTKMRIEWPRGALTLALEPTPDGGAARRRPALHGARGDLGRGGLFHGAGQGEARVLRGDSIQVLKEE
jgi:hypothetical protein